MKHKALALLKEKFQGVSDDILTRVANKIASKHTDEESVKAAVEAVTFQSVLESYGDSRANEAQQTAVTNYEKKYNLKDGKTVEPDPQPEDKPDKEVPAWAKALIESNTALKQELESMKGQTITKTRRKKISDITAKLPESMRKAYDRTPVDNITDDEFNTLVESIESEVGEIVETQRARGAVFGTPRGNGGKDANGPVEATDEQVEAIVSRMNL